MLTELRLTITGADPELLLGGGTNSWGGGHLPNILVVFSEKPYEIKEILLRRGGAHRGHHPLNPPLNQLCLKLIFTFDHFLAFSHWNMVHTHWNKHIKLEPIYVLLYLLWLGPLNWPYLALHMFYPYKQDPDYGIIYLKSLKTQKL